MAGLNLVVGRKLCEALLLRDQCLSWVTTTHKCQQ